MFEEERAQGKLLYVWSLRRCYIGRNQDKKLRNPFMVGSLFWSKKKVYWLFLLSLLFDNTFRLNAQVSFPSTAMAIQVLCLEISVWLSYGHDLVV